MRRLLIAILTAIASASPTTAGFVTYSLVDHPSLENGYNLSGFITTDAATLVSANDITAWGVSFKSSSGVLIGTYASTDPDASTQLTGKLYANSVTLSIAQDTILNEPNVLTLAIGPYGFLQYADTTTPSDVPDFTYFAELPMPGTTPLWLNQQDPAPQYFTIGSTNGGDGNTNPVPTPASLTLMGIGAAVLLSVSGMARQYPHRQRTPGYRDGGSATASAR